jgi:hypothetical protein
MIDRTGVRIGRFDPAHQDAVQALVFQPRSNGSMVSTSQPVAVISSGRTIHRLCGRWRGARPGPGRAIEK